MKNAVPVLAIDPGTTHSAWCRCENGFPIHSEKIENTTMLCRIRGLSRAGPCLLAVEMIASYGMPTGFEVFETCVWIGRFIEAWGGDYTLVYRKDVKMHLCGTLKANDANIRQALIDRFGPTKDRAIGTKKRMGPLYGFSGDQWAALAVAVTASDKMEGE